MWAALGGLVFDVLSAPAGWQTKAPVEFVEHKVIEGRPRLQWIGDGLRTIGLDLALHERLGDPDAQIAALEKTAAAHAALPLVCGDGRWLGYWVVTEVAVTLRQADAWGRTVAAQVRVELKEWAGSPADTSGTAKAAGAAAGASPVLLQEALGEVRRPWRDSSST